MLSGGDAGNTLDDATLIAISEGNGWVYNPMDRFDYYKFPVVKDQEVSVWMSTKNGIVSTILYDTNMLNVDRATYDDTDDPPVLVSWTPTKDGFFYLQLQNAYAIGMTYSLTISGMAQQVNEAPVASFTWYMDGPTLWVDATDSTDDGSIAGYYWYLDDEQIDDSYGWDTWYWEEMNDGTYLIELIVEDNQGLFSELVSDEVVIDLVDEVPPVAVIDYWFENRTVEFTANRSSGVVDIDLYYWWSVGELKNETDWESWYLDNPVVTDYNITLIVVDYNGVSSEPETVLFNVTSEQIQNEAPIADFTWYMEDGTLNVNASTSTDDTEIVFYFWAVDDEPVDNSTDWEWWWWTEVEAGDYEISLIVMDKNGESSEIVTETVTVEEPETPNEDPDATFDWYERDETLFVDGSESSDSDGEIVEYTWYIDGTHESSFDNSVSWSLDDLGEGEYRITLEVTDDEGAEDSFRTNILIEGEEEEGGFQIPSYPALSILMGLASVIYLRNRAKRESLNI